MRHRFVFTLIITLAFASDLLAQEKRLPNIIHFLGDDIGYDDSSSCGSMRKTA